MLNVILHGAAGTMGQAMARCIAKKDGVSVLCGVDPRDFPAAFPVYHSLDECPRGDVIVDFSTAAVVPGLLDYCVRTGTPAVVCTTGLSDETKAKLSAASQKVAMFQSANMSLGINLLLSLVQKAAPVLTEAGFDVEIIERHHNQKVDAPSGTALMLANAINNSLPETYAYVYDRSQTRQKRPRLEIGIHSLRGGNIVGDHEVVFAGLDEVVTLTHHAASKEVFATGAVKAAVFLAGKPAGLYSMADVLR